MNARRHAPFTIDLEKDPNLKFIHDSMALQPYSLRSCVFYYYVKEKVLKKTQFGNWQGRFIVVVLNRNDLFCVLFCNVKQKLPARFLKIICFSQLVHSGFL